MKSIKGTREGSLEGVQEFKKMWQLDGAAVSSASASTQSELVDIIVEKLDGSGYYLPGVGNNAETQRSVGSGSYPLKDKPKRKGGRKRLRGRQRTSLSRRSVTQVAP